MFSKKKTECRVCGYRFTPERENIYTAEEPRSMADMLTKAPTRFSAVDCQEGERHGDTIQRMPALRRTS